MGLDMYAFVTRKAIPPVDFDDPEDAFEIFYWRKHPNLHGWMERVYRNKGGLDEVFNLVPVRLDQSDLDALEQTVNTGSLPVTAGFFFGVSSPDDKKDDLEFLRLARQAIKEGKQVYYITWW